MKNKPYWLEEPLLTGAKVDKIPDGDIAVIGSGLSGASVAYHLAKAGMEVTIIDWEPEKSASYRNAGHILWGGAESYPAMCKIHGETKAKKILDLSSYCLDTLQETILGKELDIDFQHGYAKCAIDSHEAMELKAESMKLRSDGYTCRSAWKPGAPIVKTDMVSFCTRSRGGHPVKFRNMLISEAVKMGATYVTAKVSSASTNLKYNENQTANFGVVVSCTNAWSKQVCYHHEAREDIEPFKGQIMVSRPLPFDIPFNGPFSFDHGYIYGNVLPGNRLLLGGWRNNVSGGETGVYDFDINPEIRNGLMTFAREILNLPGVEWEYEWTGLMGSSNSGLPYVGPTSQDMVYTCAGFNGYGFGWAHGCAKILADILLGNDLPTGWELLRP